MSYTALYRKFRPSEFSDVKGQDHIVTTLKNQIMADRIGHAYLFCGTEVLVKQLWQRFLRKRSTANTRWTVTLAGSVHPAGRLLPVLL